MFSTSDRQRLDAYANTSHMARTQTRQPRLLHLGQRLNKHSLCIIQWVGGVRRNNIRAKQWLAYHKKPFRSNHTTEVVGL